MLETAAGAMDGNQMLRKPLKQEATTIKRRKQIFTFSNQGQQKTVRAVLRKLRAGSWWIRAEGKARMVVRHILAQTSGWTFERESTFSLKKSPIEEMPGFDLKCF